MTDPTGRLAALLTSLDRCPHGRHQKDPCVACPGGQSAGNPHLPAGEVIGYDHHGDPIHLPEHDEDRYDPKAWVDQVPAPLLGRDLGADAIYRERNRLVAALTRRWPSLFTEAPDAEGWWIVYIVSPAGQLSWHIAPHDLDLFAHVRRVESWRWDGHSTGEKYERLDLAALIDAGMAPRSAADALGDEQ